MLEGQTQKGKRTIKLYSFLSFSSLFLRRKLISKRCCLFFSHLLGMFYRTIRMVDNGIKPVYVFDGKPPAMKTSELEKRTERRSEAEKQRSDAVELGDTVSVNKFERRLVKVLLEHSGLQ